VDFTITVNWSDPDGEFGTVTIFNVAQSVAGAGGFGFYATGSSTITSLTVRDSTRSTFAIGEFGIGNGAAPPAAPEPSSLTLFGLGSLGLLAYGRRRRKA
jgi:hypothetical protein